MEENKIASFSTLNLILEEEKVEFPNIRNVFMKHLQALALDFECCIPEDVIKYSWVHSLFKSHVKDLTDDISSTAGLHDRCTENQNKKDTVLQFVKLKRIT